MHRFFISLILTAAALAASAANGKSAAEPAAGNDTWMSVTQAGRKVGQLHNVRTVRDGRIFTTQTMDMQLERAGVAITMYASETSEETPTGQPLGFTAQLRLSGIETQITGVLDAGTLHISSAVGGASSSSTQAWPSGALLAEGLRLAALRKGLAQGTEYDDLAYQPSMQAAFSVHTRVTGTEIVDLPAGRQTLYRMDQRIAVPGMPIPTTAYVDSKQNVHKIVMEQLGLPLELLACDRACATAPNQSADLLQRSLISAPRALSKKDLRDGLRYRLSAIKADPPLEIPSTNEQRVSRQANSFVVEVAGLASAGGSDKPVAADSAANAWLQSDSAQIIDLAHQAVGEATDDLQRMQQLEQFVRNYIGDKNLTVGYASALEVLKTREGDCTEHAVLLAALGRALSIPTRVVDGLAYTSSFANAERVFVPHAWVHAWVNGRWQSFDAALNGFDAGHIALGVGDGDPWRFFSGVAALGNLKLDRVDALSKP